MNEPRKAGRPRKTHLENEHHFKPATPDNDSAADASPADSEAGQESASISDTEFDVLSAPTQEAVVTSPAIVEAVETHPTTAPDVGIKDSLMTTSSENLVLTEEKFSQYVKNVTTHGDGLRNQEGLIEESNILTLNGWQPLETDILLKQPPRNGMPVYVTSRPDKEGMVAFWKRTRAFNGKRWEETGKWVDFNTGMNLVFQPKYWKARA